MMPLWHAAKYLKTVWKYDNGQCPFDIVQYAFRRSTFSHTALSVGTREGWTIAQLYQPTKRRFPRYRYESSVNISVLRGDTPTIVGGMCKVLGEGGASLYSDEKLGMHEILYVEIPLDSRDLRLPAAVRNQHDHEYGVEFLALAKPERELLRTTFSSLPQVG